MVSPITYRRGSLDDLFKLRFAPDLLLTPEAVEFNVVGMGHEFWIAIEADMILSLIVLGRTTATQRTILYLHVSASHENRGIGSALLRSVIESYGDSEFVVIPFDGTEEFYHKLGFVKTDRWEMRRPRGGH